MSGDNAASDNNGPQFDDKEYITKVVFWPGFALWPSQQIGLLTLATRLNVKKW